MERFRMELESLSKNEEFARVVVAVFLSRLDPTMEEIDDVKTAVSEAVTNAIIHGYAGERGTVRMHAYYTDEATLTVDIIDRGCGIADIRRAMEPFFTTQPEKERSGMGFAVMQSFMDAIRVESEVNAGTTVYMEKQLRLQEDAPREPEAALN